jgi:hypothetical protein
MAEQLDGIHLLNTITTLLKSGNKLIEQYDKIQASDDYMTHLLCVKSNTVAYINSFAYFYPYKYVHADCDTIYTYYIYKSKIVNIPKTSTHALYSHIALPDACGECILTLNIKIGTYLNVLINDHATNTTHCTIAFTKHQRPQHVFEKMHIYIKKQPKYVYCSTESDVSLVNKIATDIATNEHHGATPREYATLLSLLGYNTAVTATVAPEKYAKMAKCKLLQNLTRMYAAENYSRRLEIRPDIEDMVLFRIDDNIAIYVPDDIAMRYFTFLKLKTAFIELKEQFSIYIESETISVGLYNMRNNSIAI